MAYRADLEGALAEELGREPSSEEFVLVRSGMERHLAWIEGRLPDYPKDKSLKAVARHAAEEIRARARERAKPPLRRAANRLAVVALVVGVGGFMCYLLWMVPPGAAYGSLGVIIGGVIGWRNPTGVPAWESPRWQNRIGTAFFYVFIALWVACMATGLHYSFDE